MTFADLVLTFLQSLKLSAPVPHGVQVMDPYRDAYALNVCAQFYRKYYNDNNRRTLILGINPGRYGGGVTGVPFTDPVKLANICGIPNTLKKKPELSADFIYAMIDAFGGPASFYERFYISAISPLGFTKDGKNLNYYDMKELKQVVEPFAVDCLRRQSVFPVNRSCCFCLGEGENYKYMKQLNDTYRFFEHIEPLPHPRFIMQYKRKHVSDYVHLYVKKFEEWSVKSLRF